MAKKLGKSAAKSRPAASSTQSVKKNPSAGKKPVKSRSRRLKLPKYESFRLQKRVKHPIRLPSVWSLTKSAWQTIWTHRGLFAGIGLMYGLLNFILVRGLSTGGNISLLRENFDQTYGAHLNPLLSGAGTFFNLLDSNQTTAVSPSSTQPTNGYELFLLLFVSLAVIWALRQVMAGHRIRIRDTYYRGMFPLVPFILVLLVIGLQLIPALIGGSLYTLVTSNGIAVYAIEKVAWALMYGLLVLLSLYMISSSIFALYIVALPDMTPLKALRSARGLVRYRRWTVLRKVLFLPVLLLIVASIIMVPVIVLVPALAQIVYLLLLYLSPVAVHAYMYTFYRELIND